MLTGAANPQLVRAVKGQLDQLPLRRAPTTTRSHYDAADSGRVTALALHPFVIGLPFRLKYLGQALEYGANHPGVWVTRSDEIAAHFVSGRNHASAGPDGTA
ncbi:hypothetical protein [Streptomyces sp. NPDC059994]|uniref:hypothetical protein n=1 Tax=Streptomyces sp. NPDC059994 TaxID=3347029 RepID=UPI0036AEA5A7